MKHLNHSDSTGSKDYIEPREKKFRWNDCIILIIYWISSIAVLWLKPIYALLLGVFEINQGIKSLKRSRQDNTEPKRNRVKAIGYFLPAILLIISSYLRIDASPIENDYKLADLKIVPIECLSSYDLLLSLADDKSENTELTAIGLSEQERDKVDKIYGGLHLKSYSYSRIELAIEPNKAEIFELWERSQKGRLILEKLDTYTQIADLTEPNINVEFNYLKNIRCLSQLTWEYACVQTSEGRREIGIAELEKLQSIVEKLNPNCRSLINKLVCIAIFAGNIQTANHIANHPGLSDSDLMALVRYFPSLTENDLSMRNTLIYDYLVFKNSLDFFIKEAASTKFDPYIQLGLKYNSTIRVCHNLLTDLIIQLNPDLASVDPLRIWPSVYPNLNVDLNQDYQFPWYYTAYNFQGTLLIKILFPSLERVLELRTKLLIHSDLFQIVLNLRQGNPVDLTARAYGEKYIIDIDQHKILSPGPDKVIHTKDDIFLTINPEVIDLKTIDIGI